MTKHEIVVVKLGGSLLKAPGLYEKLSVYLAQIDALILLVVGGGEAVQRVREIDQQVGLQADVAHNMALMAMSVNAGEVCSNLSNARMVRHLKDANEVWEKAGIAVVEPTCWLPEEVGDRVIKSWQMTSDSIAGLIAQGLGCRRLVLLKACQVSEHLSISEMVEKSIVDDLFEKFSSGINQVEVKQF